jgi:NAD(P)-dependent dehydrogenase (short-subunit alcohol dehydrogenase family)
MAMADAGASVAVVARSAADLTATADALEVDPDRVLTVRGDLADPVACREAVERTADAFGRLDVLVNVAGTDVPKLVEELAVEEWNTVLDVGLRAPFLLAKHAFPHLRAAGGGTIINVSSVAGRRGWAGASAYCSAKFGLTGLTQALNAEGRAHAIRACVVYPGAMATHWGAWSPEERHATGGPEDAEDPSAALPPSQVADLLVWIAAAPAGLVLNESIVTPLHEQGWP